MAGPVVFVTCEPGAEPPFGWEIRRGGALVAAGSDGFSSSFDARSAGEGALALLRAQPDRAT